MYGRLYVRCMDAQCGSQFMHNNYSLANVTKSHFIAYQIDSINPLAHFLLQKRLIASHSPFHLLLHRRSDPAPRICPQSFHPPPARPRDRNPLFPALMIHSLPDSNVRVTIRDLFGKVMWWRSETCDVSVEFYYRITQTGDLKED